MSAVDYSLQNDEARETAICEVRGLSKSYRNFWLNDVSFKLEPGYNKVHAAACKTGLR